MNQLLLTLLLIVLLCHLQSSNALRLNSSLQQRRPRHSLSAADQLPDVVDPSFNLAAGSAVLGTAFGVLENFKGPTAKLFGGGAIAFTLFGGFLAFQTSTLRFQFDETNFSLVKVDGGSTGKNVVVGGDNSWAYSSFVNWDFLPNEEFPILVYFKETQTPREQWVEAPIVVDNLPGQAHFFPAIADVQKLKQSFMKHKCQRAGDGAAAKSSLQVPSKLTL